MFGFVVEAFSIGSIVIVEYVLGGPFIIVFTIVNVSVFVSLFMPVILINVSISSPIFQSLIHQLHEPSNGPPIVRTQFACHMLDIQLPQFHLAFNYWSFLNFDSPSDLADYRKDQIKVPYVNQIS